METLPEKGGKTKILTGGSSLTSIIVIISRPLPCCSTGAVVSVTKTVIRITCGCGKFKEGREILEVEHVFVEMMI